MAYDNYVEIAKVAIERRQKIGGKFRPGAAEMIALAVVEGCKEKEATPSEFVDIFTRAVESTLSGINPNWDGSIA